MESQTGSYSAKVRAELIVGNQIFALGEVGPFGCMVREPKSVPPGEAEIILYIDQNVYRHRVFLIDGISPDSERVRVRNLTETVISRD